MIGTRDNFLTEKELEKYKNRQDWVDIAKQGYFWLDRKAKSNNIFEDYILDNLADCFTNQIEGFEYWINILSPGSQLDWHFDKDEWLYKSEKIVHPFKSTVWYGYPHEVEGGQFEAKGIDTYVDPLYNRLLAFDGDYEHRVRDIIKGERIGLSVNLWVYKPEHLNLKNPITMNEINEHTNIR